jgi:hypothetical protein
MIVTLDAKRRLTVPASLAPASPGDYFDASFDAEEDALVFRRLPGKENWLNCAQSLPSQPGRCAAGAGARPPGAGSYELAARHRRHLPAGQAARRCTGHRLARTRNKTGVTRAPSSSRNWLTGSAPRMDSSVRILQAWLTRLVEALQGRIHGFNVSVAHVWAEQERLLDKVPDGVCPSKTATSLQPPAGMG